MPRSAGVGPAPSRTWENHPRHHQTTWAEELQGITNDGTAWYLSQRTKIWRFPVGWDLASHIVYLPASGEPILPSGWGFLEFHSDDDVLIVPLQPETTILKSFRPRALREPEDLNHFGDLSFHDGLLYVPVEQKGAEGQAQDGQS